MKSKSLFSFSLNIDCLTSISLCTYVASHVVYFFVEFAFLHCLFITLPCLCYIYVNIG
jgi:hypothetical protein